MGDAKAVYWVGSSYSDLMEFPKTARRNAGYQLHRVQNELEPDDWKPMSSIGSGVNEIRISDDGNTYRVIYVAKFAERIYVLHTFQKKTRKTSDHDLKLAKARYNAVLREELP